jgi:hypothetical protein
MIREHELIIRGDEAWTPQEWKRRNTRGTERLQRRRERHRIYMREYRARNRDRINARNREWMARYRKSPLRVVKGPPPRLVGSLHSLACAGPTKDTGCRCSKVRCYSKPR